MIPACNLSGLEISGRLDARGLRAWQALRAAGTAVWTAPDASAKLAKGLAHAVSAAVHYLAPASTAGVGNLCPWSTPGCRAGCLHTAGRAGILLPGRRTNAILRARRRRARAFMLARAPYLARMLAEAQRHVASARAAGFEPALRPNGTSDLPWERILPALFDLGAPVYDYTKSRARIGRFLRGELPPNYHLTYSAHEFDSPEALADLLRDGAGVAVVFDAAAHAETLAAGTWQGFPVVDGDESDARYLDRMRHGIPDRVGYVVALRAKGKAKRDRSGFVRRACGGGAA